MNNRLETDVETSIDSINPELLKQKSFDPSEKAEVLLDAILDGETPKEAVEAQLRDVAVEEARAGKRVLQHDSGRTMSRVLYVTENIAYLEKGSSVQNKLRLQALLFDEVHVLVLTNSQQQQSATRIANNVWVYKTGSPNWWQKSNQALEFVQNELVFSDSFRADIVVGLDPFWSGAAALKIARYFDRSIQIHVTENYYRTAFQEERHYRWRMRLMKYVLKRADSVRVSSVSIKEILEKKIKRLVRVEVLPLFHNYKGLLTAKPTTDLHETYKGYTFIMLTFAPLTVDSPLQDVFTALHDTLHNPRVGLVVVGEGGARSLYDEKARLLGIEKNVIFISRCTDLVSCLKTADLLIQSDVSETSEPIVLKAAAAGLPMVLYETELRKDLFEDGESATLCTPGDTFSLAKETTHFLNNSALRIQYAQAAQYVVSTRLQEDETAYYKAFRDSVETGIVTTA